MAKTKNDTDINAAQKNVAIVVLNWNGIKDTFLCLDSLQKLTYESYTILVIDNGSHDDSVTKLRDYQRENTGVVLIENPTNLGFAGGVNTGIHYAIDHNFDYVALFNNDATAESNWLSQLVSSMHMFRAGAVTGLLLHSDGETIDSSGDWYSIWGLCYPRSRDQITSSRPSSGYVFGATGGATLYNTSLFTDIGYFDEDFFAYFEDVDISFRAQLAGFKIYYTNKAIAYHKQGATSNKIPGFSLQMAFKNWPLLFIKNVPNKFLFTIGWRFIVAYSLMLGKAVLGGRGLPALRGVFSAIQLVPKKVHERRTIQSSRRASDAYIDSILWHDLPPTQPGLRKVRSLLTGGRK